MVLVAAATAAMAAAVVLAAATAMAALAMAAATWQQWQKRRQRLQGHRWWPICGLYYLHNSTDLITIFLDIAKTQKCIGTKNVCNFQK